MRPHHRTLLVVLEWVMHYATNVATGDCCRWLLTFFLNTREQVTWGLEFDSGKHTLAGVTSH